MPWPLRSPPEQFTVLLRTRVHAWQRPVWPANHSRARTRCVFRFATPSQWAHARQPHANPPEQPVLLRLWALCFGSSRRRSRHTCPSPCEARRSSLLSCSGQGSMHGKERCGPPTIAVLGLAGCFGSQRRRSGHARTNPCEPAGATCLAQTVCVVFWFVTSSQ